MRPFWGVSTMCSLKRLDLGPRVLFQISPLSKHNTGIRLVLKLITKLASFLPPHFFPSTSYFHISLFLFFNSFDSPMTGALRYRRFRRSTPSSAPTSSNWKRCQQHSNERECCKRKGALLRRSAAAFRRSAACSSAKKK